MALVQFNVDLFDPQDTQDPVLVRLFTEIETIAQSPEIQDVFCLQFQKLWRIKQLSSRQVDDIADILEALHCNDGVDIDRDDFTEWEKAAFECQARIYRIWRSNKRVRKEVCLSMEAIITAFGYSPIPSIGKRRMDELSYILYATVSDSIYRRQPPVSKSCNVITHYQIEVITYLHLCGGRPSTSEPINIEIYADLENVINAIRSVHRSGWEGQSVRLGSLTWEAATEGEWFQQCAVNIANLQEDKWEALSEDSIGKLKASGPNLHVFVIHKTQLDTPAAIKAKQEHLLQGSHGAGLAWALTHKLPDALNGIPLPPVEFVPRFAAMPSAPLQLALPIMLGGTGIGPQRPLQKTEEGAKAKNKEKRKKLKGKREGRGGVEKRVVGHKGPGKKPVSQAKAKLLEEALAEAGEEEEEEDGDEEMAETGAEPEEEEDE